MMRSRIEKLITAAIGEKDFSFNVTVSENDQFGHYSTNAAMKLAKLRKESPIKVAEDLKQALINVKKNPFEKIEVANGFVNFWVKDEILFGELKKILKEKKNYGKIKAKANASKINLEFISANPTGPVTMGNARSAFWGDAMVRILKSQGIKAHAEYYVNDSKVSNQIKEIGKTMLGLGESYKSEYTEEVRKKLEKKLIKFKDKPSEAGFLAAQEIQKSNKQIIGKKLGIKFDIWFSEESLYRSGAVKNLLKVLKEKDLTYEKEGALWFKSSEYGDSEDRVLIRNTGEPTYVVSDIAYYLNKLKTRKFDKAICVLGADHHGYAPRLKAALRALGIDVESRLEIFITQLARLVKGGEEVRMSKRKGEYITLEELVDEVGPDAARFFFLMHSLDTHMDFDLNLAKERSMKNPVYYVQYAGVRATGILNKAPRIIFALKPNFNLLTSNADISLIRKLAQFPEILNDTARQYNPQALVRYSLDLAREFNNFYEKEKTIIEDKKVTRARLALVEATRSVLNNSMNLLGVSTPKKM